MNPRALAVRLGRRESSFALVMALLALAAGWFLPWRPILAGEEQLGPEKAAQSRQAVAAERVRFQVAQSEYQSYIGSHDLGALLEQSKASIARVQNGQASSADVDALGEGAAQVLDYARILHAYAAAGDSYMAALQQYDDDLMNWTRGLFAASEALRSQTWPFVEHLKLYPEPVGQKTDPPMVRAPVVAAQLASLEQHRVALTSGSSAGDLQAAAQGVATDVEGIWASGRSVEYVASLHSEYDAELSAYDVKVQEAARNPQDLQLGGTRRWAAPTLTALLGLVTLGGLAALFLPRHEDAG